MAEIDVLKAQIVRDSLSVPWGFRLQGGADFGQPLTILRITAGSPAARIGLKSGDEVTEIGDVVTRNLSHDQASAVIAQYGQSIILTVERRARGNLPTHPVMNPSAASGQQPGRPYDMYDLTSTPNQPQLNPRHLAGLQLKAGQLPLFMPVDVPLHTGHAIPGPDPQGYAPPGHAPQCPPNHAPPAMFTDSGVAAPDGQYGPISSVGGFVPPAARGLPRQQRQSEYEGYAPEVQGTSESMEFQPFNPAAMSSQAPPPSPSHPPIVHQASSPPSFVDGGYRNPSRRSKGGPPPPDGEYGPSSFPCSPQSQVAPPPPPPLPGSQVCPPGPQSPPMASFMPVDGGYSNPSRKPSGHPPPPDGEYGPASSSGGGYVPPPPPPPSPPQASPSSFRPIDEGYRIPTKKPVGGVCAPDGEYGPASSSGGRFVPPPPPPPSPPQAPPSSFGPIDAGYRIPSKKPVGSVCAPDGEYGPVSSEPDQESGKPKVGTAPAHRAAGVFQPVPPRAAGVFMPVGPPPPSESIHPDMAPPRRGPAPYAQPQFRPSYQPCDPQPQAYQVGPQSYHTASARPFESPALPKAPPPPAPEPQPEYRPQPQFSPRCHYERSLQPENFDMYGPKQSGTFNILRSLMANEGKPTARGPDSATVVFMHPTRENCSARDLPHHQVMKPENRQGQVRQSGTFNILASIMANEGKRRSATHPVIPVITIIKQPGPPPQQYSTYTDEEEDQGLQQSRTFKILQSLMENDGEPPPPVLFARKTPGIPTATIPGQGPGSHPKVVANRQFNTPIGLYDQGVAMDTMGQKMDSIAVTESKNEQTSSDPTGPKPYVASETMRLVKQLDEEEKMYGRPNFPPAKSSKPPVGRVLDEAVPSKPSPGGAYVPNYQKSKSLAHVIHSSNEQVRRFSTGTKEPQEEKERRLSGSNPPDSLPGYRKVEPPQPSPLTRSVKSESPTPTPYLRPVTKVESSTAVPFTRTVKTESPIPNLLTRPMKADTTTPTPFTRSVKAESPTHTLFTCQVNVENPVPAPFICPVKESPTSTPYAQPVKAESPTTIPYVRQVKAESPTPTSYGHLVKAESPTPLIRPVKAESPTPSPFSRTPNSHSDSGYQTPTSLGSPMHINTTNTESEGNSAPYPYQPVSSPKTPETQTHTFTSSMVVNTSRAQIKLPSSFNSSSTSSPIVSSSAPPETKGNSSPAPSNSSNSSTIVSHSASSSSSSSATSGSYFIPATGLDNAVPVNIATTAATSSIIEAALKPKIRPYKKPEYSDNQSPTDTAQMMVTVSPQYKKSEQTTASTQKQTQQQIVVDEPGFPMATITVLMPEGQHGSELETSSSHGASGRSSPWYQPSHSQLSSSFSPRAEGIQTETKPGTYMMDVSPRATITIPKRRSTSDPPPPEPCTNTDVIILNEAPRATIKIPRTFHCNSESKPESDNPRSEVILNKAPLATANIPVQFQTTSTSASENVKQQPRHSITRPSTAKVDKDTSGTKRLSQTSTNTVTLNEAPRKTIQLTGKFQHDHELEQKEKIEIAASSKEKFQKLASMFQNKEQETQKTIPAPKRTIKIPSTFKQSGETNGKPEKPVRIEPIKLPSSVDKLPTSADICTSEEKHNASIGPVASQNLHTSTVSSHTSHTFQPVSNGRPTGFRSVKPPQAEQAQIVAPVPSYSTADYLETPTSPDLPPPEFPPPPPPPESPPLSPDFCSEFPLPPPPQTDCPVTQTTPDLPPPPAIAAAPGANRKEENAQQLYAKYADLRKDAERGPLQSRTFNALSNMVEGEPEPAAGVSALPPQRSAYREQQQREAQVARPGRPGGPGAQQQAPGAPRVKVFMPQQYNTPLSMYSAQNVVETFQGQAEMQLDQLEQKHPDVISGAQRAVLEDDSGYRATSDF